MTFAKTPSAAPAADPLRAARDLRATAIAALGRALGPDAKAPYALLDFPCYANVGDNAIWLGTLAALKTLGLPPPAYTCDDRTFDARALLRRVGQGPILLLGGGNFGDLHRKHQRLREAVVAAFPANRVVQLPQTIHFRSAAERERAARALGGHRDFRVLVRDEASLAAARDDLHLDAALAPDLALALIPPPRAAPPAPSGPSVPKILWISRLDHWRREAPRVSDERLLVSDWPPEGRPWRVRKVRALVALHRIGAAKILPVRASLSAAYEPLARWRVDRALAWMSDASVVVTDRLHGHLLAVMTGVPHVLLDDTLGKVRGFFDAWTHDAGLAIWASDPADALARAKALLGTPS